TNSACSPKNYALVYQRIAQMFPNIVFYVAGVSPSQQETDFNDKSKIVKTDFEVRWAQGDYWLYQSIMEIKNIMSKCPSGVALHAYGDISESGEGTIVNDIKSQIRALRLSGCAQVQTIVSEFNSADVYKNSPSGLAKYIPLVYEFFKSQGIDGSMWFTYGKWGEENEHKNAAINADLKNAINNYGK
ncbi:MAG: hypothetical protein KBD78_04520, partial [Oligoflexales bacterium]|nr:hypothetical protein [Oligoflexales bacterium]